MKIKTIELKKKLRSKPEYFERDFDAASSCFPGEWVQIKLERGGLEWVMMNPFAEGGPIGRRIDLDVEERETEEETAREAILSGVLRAIKKRREYSFLSHGSRLLFGQGDGIPGLVMDEYEEVVLVQINTAGVDRFRDHVKETLIEETGKKVFFIDNSHYQKIEGLPSREKDELVDLKIKENGIQYFLKREVIQKVGYYYDHRINRMKMSFWIESLLDQNEFNKGVDLFCYAGAWGLHALKSGVQKMDFVDQGNFEETIDKNLELNKFESRGLFYRADVLKWIQAKERELGTYDLVISDPPAFSKSLKNKSKALGGYEKLHYHALQLLRKGGLFVAASCTKGVTLEELDRSVQASSQGQKLRLLDIGLQGPDHPIKSLNDQGNYIKFLIYRT